MRCKQVEPMIGAWQDGELDALTSWRVGHHVRNCPTCAAEADSLTELTDALRQAAPLGAVEPVSPPRRVTVAPLSLTLASAAVVALLIASRPPGPPTPIPDTVAQIQNENPARPVETPVPTRNGADSVAMSNAPRKPANEPEERRIAVRKKPGFRLRPVRVSRKPSLLPPLTHPDWIGSSIRYVATLTPAERQVEIISIESELPPDEELRRLVEEKSEFIYVQASLPPELREGAQDLNPVIP